MRVVYVLLGKPMNPQDPLGATPPRPLYAPGRHTQATLQQDFEALDFITYVNKQTLNQALITCVLKSPPPPPAPPPTTPAPTTPATPPTTPATPPTTPTTPPTTSAPTTPAPPPPGLAPAYQVLLDEAQLKHDKLLLNGALKHSSDVTSYCEKVANATPGVGPFAGLTIFVHELNVPKSASGAVTTASGTIFPVEAKTLNVYRVGLSAGSQRTIAHELGHVLGLMHSFPDVDDSEATQYMAAIEKAKKDVAVEKQRLTNATNVSATQQIQQNIQNLITQIAWLGTQFLVFKNNPFKFTQFSTENLMDYEQGKKRISYWHWQWQLLQADVATYYGTKTSAQ